MYGKMQEYLRQTLAEIKEAGLYKEERLIESAQQAAITVKGKEVLNFCANNYLGLSNHPRLIKASQEMMNNRGYGMSSVRFICGTQDIHKELEAAVSDYFQTEDTILYAACFDANGGLGNGGTNFDAKTRRNSTDLEDIFIAHIAGMDAMARALESAAALLNESPYKKMLADRYASFDGGKGKEFEDGKLTLEDVVAYAKANGEPKQTSGKQELYEAILNMYC